MKVLLIANITSTHTKKWALALKSHGLTVGLFSLHAPVLSDPWYNSLDHVYFPLSNKGNILLKYLRFNFHLRKTISAFQPEILHSHFITNYSFLAGLSGFKPHVLTAWGSDVFLFPKKSFLHAAFIRYNLIKATALISTSEVMAKELKLYTTKQVQVIPFGIDFNIYKFSTNTQNQDKKTIQIGCFKQIEAIYGTDILLRAFALAEKKLAGYDLKLLIAGEGTLLPQMKELAKELGIEKQVEFAGWVNADRVPVLLHSMDVCMYLSRHESFGVSLLEAMATGVPLVVSRTVGFMEVAETNENALFVPINDAEQSANALVELISNKELYTNMRDHAYTHALKKYDLQNNISQQISLYERIIEAGRRS
ncbi:MAG: glycosyltransferase family 4 protein [bacterium]|nr:glycosyltransferase family 4 protein [bacterium]